MDWLLGRNSGIYSGRGYLLNSLQAKLSLMGLRTGAVEMTTILLLGASARSSINPTIQYYGVVIELR